ncbi:MAG TPA: hypothetical protein VFC46_03230 [Humisphaera sp.]|nr:hypothetical protein [Humisphaera sp.]
MTNPRIVEYERRHHCRLLELLGSGPGQDGFVLRSDRMTAVKFFDRTDRFHRELEVYEVLREREIHDIAGHRAPRLIASDEELRAIEMTIVGRPFVLDFAGAKAPDEIPDFEPHVMDEHMEHLQELFGERWADALHVAEMFRLATGFVLLDIHPGNIAFAD